MQRLARALGQLGRGVERLLFRSRELAFLSTLCLAFLLLSASLSLLLFGAVPHVQDSVAQFVHAKAFAQGMLTAPAPPLRHFFETPLMIVRHGRWYSQFPPGHTALLALGHLAGAPWLVNPVLGCLTIPAVHALARATYGFAVARVAALLTLLCPFVVVMSSEFMNHASSLLFCTLFALFAVRALERGSPRSGLLAGAALGAACLSRPYAALSMAAPFALLGLYRLVRAPRRLAPAAAAAAAALLAFAAIQASFNFETNGDPLLYGYQVKFGPTHRPGFVERPPTFFPGRHTPAEGIAMTAKSLVGLNRFLFEWPGSSLLFLPIALLARPRSPWTRVLLATPASMAVANVFYFYQDLCFGPRFLYESTAALLILTAAGMVASARFLQRRRPLVGRPHAGAGAVCAAVAGLYLASALFLLPGQLAYYADRYWGVDGGLHERLLEQTRERSLVLITSEYRSVSFLNPQPEDARVIFARSMRSANPRILDLYPDRFVYLEEEGRLRLLRGPGDPLGATRSR